MKRKTISSLIGLGLFLWVWIGSYVYFRVSAPARLYVLSFDPSARFIGVPDWVDSIDFVYQPLIAIDRRFTGERVQFVHYPRIHIGATANF